jgi:hypothetical protein
VARAPSPFCSFPFLLDAKAKKTLASCGCGLRSLLAAHQCCLSYQRKLLMVIAICGLDVLCTDASVVCSH